jgi:hypothetical protein
MGPIGYTTNNNNFNFPCYFRDRYQTFISSLVVQYNVDVSIIEYNLYRMDECLKIFSNELIRRHRCNPEIFTLSDEQKTYALEFYLQIDGTFSIYNPTCFLIFNN